MAGVRRFFERAIHLHSALEKITIGQLGADPLRRLRREACQRQLKVARQRHSSCPVERQT